MSRLRPLPARKVIRALESLGGLGDRGTVSPGFWAGLVVFDLPRVRDRATNLRPHTHPFENYPHQDPEGIDWLLANGRVAIEDGKPTKS